MLYAWGLLTFAIRCIFAAVFHSDYFKIRQNRKSIIPHFALPEQKISHKSDRSGKRQQTLMNISVIIPTFNRCDLVIRAIHSVVNQTHPATEIIVIDDGSNDETGNEVKQGFPSVKLISQKNQGVSKARNVGIEKSTCDWIAFLDSDDEWHRQKLARQVNFIKQNPQLAVCHTDEIWIRNGVRVNPMKKHKKPNGWIFDQCLPLCCVSPSSVLLHKKILDHVGGFDTALPACEDYDLWLRIFSKYPIGLVEDGLVTKYGGHEDQLSRQYWGMDRFRVYALDKLLKQNILSSQNYASVCEVLRKKTNILIAGFEKRKKSDEANKFRTIRNRWCGHA